MIGAHIAATALQEVGTHFRKYGRTSGVALDCAGLVALAIGRRDVRIGYSLKGDHSAEIASYFQNAGFTLVPATPHQDGDIALVSCAPLQLHLMVFASNGWVHAHAGLGRVVHMPGISPWPIIALWRFCGE